MNAVLAWKVYREQRLVWVAMAALAVGIMVVYMTLLGPGQKYQFLGGWFCLIAYTYGMVAAALLLAGEQEASTSTFLEVLPVQRLAVWRVKVLAAAVLVL